MTEKGGLGLVVFNPDERATVEREANGFAIMRQLGHVFLVDMCFLAWKPLWNYPPQSTRPDWEVIDFAIANNVSEPYHKTIMGRVVSYGGTHGKTR